jgi:hypothetical protein
MSYIKHLLLHRKAKFGPLVRSYLQKLGSLLGVIYKSLNMKIKIDGEWRERDTHTWLKNNVQNEKG